MIGILKKMTKQQILAAKLFKATKIRKVMSERMFENFRVSIPGVVDYRTIDIVFHDDVADTTLFSLVVDEDWFLCSDGKLRQSEESAELFGYIKVNPKSGRVYIDVLDRALEAVYFALNGKFKKEIEVA